MRIHCELSKVASSGARGLSFTTGYRCCCHDCNQSEGIAGLIFAGAMEVVGVHNVITGTLVD